MWIYLDIRIFTNITLWFVRSLASWRHHRLTPSCDTLVESRWALSRWIGGVQWTLWFLFDTFWYLLALLVVRQVHLCRERVVTGEWADRARTRRVPCTETSGWWVPALVATHLPQEMEPPTKTAILLLTWGTISMHHTSPKKCESESFSELLGQPHPHWRKRTLQLQFASPPPLSVLMTSSPTSNISKWQHLWIKTILATCLDRGIWVKKAVLSRGWNRQIQAPYSGLSQCTQSVCFWWVAVSSELALWKRWDWGLTKLGCTFVSNELDFSREFLMFNVWLWRDEANLPRMGIFQLFNSLGPNWAFQT